MTTALAVLLVLIAGLALLDMAAAAFGIDSRDGFADDNRR
jgi:hypothetical protein